jgi:putative Holliday junction resolvase
MLKRETRNGRRETQNKKLIRSDSSAICHLSSAVLTILAFDFGTKSIGVAVGQTITKSASELAPLKARDGIPAWAVIQKLIEEWRADLLIVGLPLNMDDSEFELSQRARKFANRLQEKFQMPVELVDERLSTIAAKEELANRGKRFDHKKNPVDSIAARLILETWFSDKANA